MKLLQDKNIIITGCNRGMGKQMLELFAENGANIWACARKNTDEFEQRCQNLAQQNGVEIWPVYFDLANPEEIKAGFKVIMSAKKPVVGFVNNAGITYNALFQMTTMDKFSEVFQINFFGPMLFEQYVVKLMLKNKQGSVVNIASTAGMDPTSGRTAYGASKAAVISATQTIALELGTQGIRVNAISPGITHTDMVAESMSPEIIQESIDMTMLKRIGKPIDIANTAMFLCSDLSSYITGQVIRVDGGLGRK